MKIGISSTECLLGGLALLILFSYGAKFFVSSHRRMIWRLKKG